MDFPISPYRSTVLLAILVTALSALTTTDQFNTTVGTVNQLVQVNADLSYPLLLPGSEYSRNVTVRWALPSESLQGITSDHILIHVLTYVDSQSWMVFYGNDGQAFRAYGFDLDCHLVQNLCANDSQLIRTIPLALRVPSNASTNHSEQLYVQASLIDTYQSIPLDQNSPGIFQPIQNVLQQLPIQPILQIIQPLNPAPPSPSPVSTVTPTQNPVSTPYPIQPTAFPSFPNGLPGADYVTPSPSENSSTSASPYTVAPGNTFNPNSNLSESAGTAISNSTNDHEKSSTLSGQNVQIGLSAQIAMQPSPVAPGASNASIPFAGFLIAKSDAYAYGGAIVVIVLACVFFRRFFGRKKGNGVFEA